ncbi:MAG: M23 family metallopeptidase [Geitlerinemataceae cyanobacterium]
MPNPNVVRRALRNVMRRGRLRRLLARAIGVAIALTVASTALTTAQTVPDDSAYRASISPGEWASASFPVEDFQAYTSPFGYRNIGYGSEFHSGLDLAAPEGSYIRNWWAGTVVEAIDDGRCGTGLVIKSGNWEHIYCHMQGYVETIDGVRTLVDRNGGILIREGEELPTAARIGRVGMTGRTTGPHLHWGMVYNDEWVDPATVIRAMAN